MSQTFIIINVVARNPQGKFLVMQRASGRHEHPNIWNVVTGYIQERESVENAALRELKEETNLEGEITFVTEPFITSEPETGKRWVIFAVQINVANTDTIKIDESESQNFKWIDEMDPLCDESNWIRTTLQNLSTPAVA